MRTINFIMTILMASQSLNACDGKKSESDAVTIIEEPFLTAADLQTPAMLDETTKSEIDVHMQSSKETRSLYANAPESSSSEDSGITKCMLEAMDKYPVKASGETLRVGGKVDISDCIQQVFSAQFGSSLTVKANSSMSMFAKFSCSGKDLSAADGKKFSEAVDAQSGECIGTGTTLVNLKVTMDLTLTASGQSVSLGMEVKNGTLAPDGTACAMVGTATEDTYASCVQLSSNKITKNTAQPTDAGKTEFEKTIRTNLVKLNDKTSPFFKSGTIEYIVNAWSGTLTYTDASTAPSYSMSNGTETVTGTLPTSASFALSSLSNGSIQNRIGFDVLSRQLSKPIAQLTQF